MITKTRKKLNDYAYGYNRPVRDVSKNEEKVVNLRVDGIKGLGAVSLKSDKNPELYEAFANRKNIKLKLDEGKIYDAEEVKKLKEELFSGYDIPTKEEYDAGFQKLKQAKENELHSHNMGNLARQLTYDLADAYQADKSGNRYSSVVQYAKDVLNAIGKGNSYDEIKEPNRGLLDRAMDRISDKDSLQWTKKNLQVFFDKDSLRRWRNDFAEMAKNIPEEPIENRAYGIKDGDPIVADFMDIYDQKNLAAENNTDVACSEFAVILAKREIARAAERTLEVKVKAHNDRIEKEHKKAEEQEAKKARYAENAERGKTMQKAVRRMRRASDINATITSRGRDSDRMK